MDALLIQGQEIEYFSSAKNKFCLCTIVKKKTPTCLITTSHSGKRKKINTEETAIKVIWAPGADPEPNYQGMLGRRVELHRKENKSLRKGLVVDYRPENAECNLVRFHDGDEAWINPRKFEVKILLGALIDQAHHPSSQHPRAEPKADLDDESLLDNDSPQQHGNKGDEGDKIHGEKRMSMDSKDQDISKETQGENIVRQRSPLSKTSAQLAPLSSDKMAHRHQDLMTASKDARRPERPEKARQEAYVMWYEVEESAKTYWFNCNTRESQWAPPEWIAKQDPFTGNTVYANPVTGEQARSKPEGYQKIQTISAQEAENMGINAPVTSTLPAETREGFNSSTNGSLPERKKVGIPSRPPSASPNRGRLGESEKVIGPFVNNAPGANMCATPLVVKTPVLGRAPSPASLMKFKSGIEESETAAALGEPGPLKHKLGSSSPGKPKLEVKSVQPNEIMRIIATPVNISEGPKIEVPTLVKVNNVTPPKTTIIHVDRDSSDSLLGPAVEGTKLPQHSPPKSHVQSAFKSTKPRLTLDIVDTNDAVAVKRDSPSRDMRNHTGSPQKIPSLQSSPGRDPLMNDEGNIGDPTSFHESPMQAGSQNRPNHDRERFKASSTTLSVDVTDAPAQDQFFGSEKGELSTLGGTRASPTHAGQSPSKSPTGQRSPHGKKLQALKSPGTLYDIASTVAESTLSSSPKAGPKPDKLEMHAAKTIQSLEPLCVNSAPNSEAKHSSYSISGHTGKADLDRSVKGLHGPLDPVNSSGHLSTIADIKVVPTFPMATGNKGEDPGNKSLGLKPISSPSLSPAHKLQPLEKLGSKEHGAQVAEHL